MRQIAPSDLTVCIVSWNVWEDLQACLESLYSGGNRVSFDVIVVDNASTDATPGRLPEDFPQVKLVANPENRGFASGVNQAIAAGGGRYYFLLNPDTIVPPGALDELISFADAHPQAGIIGPKLRYPDGRLQYSCRRFPTVAAAIFRNTFLEPLIPGVRSVRHYLMTDWEHDEVREVDWLSGAAMLIRAELVEEIGGLDEGFFWGSEDVDYCLRAQQAGWQVLYTPQPEIVHAVGRSSQQAEIKTILHTHRSMYRLYTKHWSRWFGSRWLIWLGIALRAGMLVADCYLRRLGGKRAVDSKE